MHCWHALRNPLVHSEPHSPAAFLRVELSTTGGRGKLPFSPSQNAAVQNASHFCGGCAPACVRPRRGRRAVSDPLPARAMRGFPRAWLLISSHLFRSSSSAVNLLKAGIVLARRHAGPRSWQPTPALHSSLMGLRHMQRGVPYAGPRSQVARHAAQGGGLHLLPDRPVEVLQPVPGGRQVCQVRCAPQHHQEGYQVQPVCIHRPDRELWLHVQL